MWWNLEKNIFWDVYMLSTPRTSWIAPISFILNLASKDVTFLVATKFYPPITKSSTYTRMNLLPWVVSHIEGALTLAHVKSCDLCVPLCRLSLEVRWWLHEPICYVWVGLVTPKFKLEGTFMSNWWRGHLFVVVYVRTLCIIIIFSTGANALL